MEVATTKVKSVIGAGRAFEVDDANELVPFLPPVPVADTVKIAGSETSDIF